MNAVAECHVTTDAVIKGIRDYLEAQKPISHFTTHEIAKQINAEEYTVRAAIGWLKHYRIIEVVPGVRSKRYTKSNGEVYSATVYQISEKKGEPDYTTLHLVFCCGGRR